MKKLMMILCLAVMAMFLVSCAGQATKSADKWRDECNARMDAKGRECDQQKQSLQGTIRALESQLKVMGESTKTIARLTADNERLTAQNKELTQKLEIAQKTGTTPVSCPEIAAQPVTVAPTSPTGLPLVYLSEMDSKPLAPLWMYMAIPVSTVPRPPTGPFGGTIGNRVGVMEERNGWPTLIIYENGVAVN